MADEIAEMNKLRAEMGAAPLPTKTDGPAFKTNNSDSDSETEDTSTYEAREALMDKNWAKLEGERQAKLAREERKLAEQKAADRAARFRVEEGKGLGELAEGERDLSTRDWIKQSKKRAKKIAAERKVKEELEAREKEELKGLRYTSKDLKGVRVGHGVEEFDDLGGEQILTLKDAEIGEESGEDELEHQGLVAQKRLGEKLKLKEGKKSATYDAADALGEKKGLLSKYDEDGKEERAFTLGKKGTAANDRKQWREEDDENAGVVTLNMADFAEFGVGQPRGSDYLEAKPEKPAKFKKAKKQKNKAPRKAVEDEDGFPAPVPEATSAAPDDAMDIDSGPRLKRTYDEAALDFDDDLQSRLAKQRRENLKKLKRDNDEDYARKILAQQEEEPQANEDDLVIDETTEFLHHIKKGEDRKKTQREIDRETLRNREAGIFEDPDAAKEPDPDEAKYEHFDEAAFNAHKAEQAAKGDTEAKPITATGLPEEDTMYNGIGSALAELRSKGSLVSDREKAQNAEGIAARDRAAAMFLARKEELLLEFEAKNTAERERDRAMGVFDKMSHREREEYSQKQNTKREQWLAQKQAEMFTAEYKPNVELKYNDEYGRAMNVKEAFKHLSHKFHGKGSGKNKTEKHLKRIEDERKAAQRGVLVRGKDGEYMDDAADIARKDLGRAGVRLN